MEIMDAVSVIIPTYNRADYLGRAVQSVLDQVDFNGEIIIIDDGSTDHTKEIVAGIKGDCTITYRYTQNRGPAAARNLGVEMARHHLIAFLDSDDHWRKDKLGKQVAVMRQNHAYAISHSGEKWLRRGVHLNQKKIHKPRHGYIFDHCLLLCAVGMSTVVMKKDLFIETGGFDVSMPCCEDYDLWLRISHQHPFLLIPEPLTFKEGGREDQVSFIHRIGMDKYRIFALMKLLDKNVLGPGQREVTIEVLQKKCAVFGKGCLKHGYIEEGKYYLEIADKYKRR
jgi:glycosyltransferase involved in cell wall biosynthesis